MTNMNSQQYDRFFDLVGNGAVNHMTEMAKKMKKSEFVNYVMEIITVNPQEYDPVAAELEALAHKFWGKYHAR